jgi:hypothetical protein
MDFTARKINLYLLFKLPAAFFCGVRIKSIENHKCIVAVRHRWINQNPFNSIYFAVQAMAAELSTGALVMRSIRKSNKNIAMLVANNKATFSKKATGRIIFTCNDAAVIEQAVKKSIDTGEGQTFWMKSIGTNEKGELISEMDFEWTIKTK